MRRFTVLDVEQRTQEWRQARAGRLCSSDAAAMLATIKSGEAAARRDLRVQLVVERLTGEPVDDGFVSADMKRGCDLEADAFSAFESATGLLVQRSGFLAHTTHLMGCSLDGHIGDFEAIVELKVPRSATHLRYLRAGTMPSEHLAQITQSMLITGAASCWFASYDPRFPPDLQLFIVEVKRETLDLAAYELAASLFLSEVEREYQAVSAMRRVPLEAA